MIKISKPKELRKNPSFQGLCLFYKFLMQPQMLPSTKEDSLLSNNFSDPEPFLSSHRSYKTRRKRWRKKVQDLKLKFQKLPRFKVKTRWFKSCTNKDHVKLKWFTDHLPSRASIRLRWWRFQRQKSSKLLWLITPVTLTWRIRNCRWCKAVWIFKFQKNVRGSNQPKSKANHLSEVTRKWAISEVKTISLCNQKRTKLLKRRVNSRMNLKKHRKKASNKFKSAPSKEQF